MQRRLKAALKAKQHPPAITASRNTSRKESLQTIRQTWTYSQTHLLPRKRRNLLLNRRRAKLLFLDRQSK